jgi:hypothetical protein
MFESLEKKQGYILQQTNILNIARIVVTSFHYCIIMLHAVWKHCLK